MATDTLTPQDEDQDAIQRHYDDEFGNLTSAEHQAQSGIPGDLGDGKEGGFFRDASDSDAGSSESSRGSARDSDATPGSGGIRAKDATEVGEKLFENGVSAAAGGGAGLVARGISKIRNNPRQSLGGFLVGVLMIGLGAVGMLYVSGPLEFIHMAQLLTGFHSSAHDDQSDVRVSRIIRYIRDPSKPQNTRLSIVATSYANKFEAKINAIGLESQFKGKFGYGDGYVVDRTNEKFKGLSDKEVKAKLVSEFGVPEGAITFDEDGRTKINVGNGYFKNTKLSRAILKSAGYSRISSSMGSRTLAKRAGVTWHPLAKADKTVLTTVEARLKAWRDNRKARITSGQKTILASTSGPVADAEGKPTDTGETNNTKNSNAEIASEAAAASDDPTKFSKFQNNLGTKIAGGAAAAVGIACMVKAVNEEVTAAKQAKVIMPLMRVGADAVSLGSQIMAGEDVDPQDVKNMYNLMHGKDANGKKSNWNDAASIRANLGEEGGVKPDDTLSNLTKGGPFDKFFNASGVGQFMDAACSTAGTIILTAFSAITGPISTVAGGIASYFFADDAINYVARWFTGAGVDPLAVGGAFGLNADYGWLLASNEINLKDGGTKLSDKEVGVLRSSSNQLNQEDFDSKSFIARTFDAKDAKSLTGKLIDRQSGDATETVSSMASGIINMPSKLSGLFGNMLSMKKASAAPASYDYGVPIYGFSAEDMEDRDVQNPYANATRAVQALESDKGSDYIEDAKTCFNVEIINQGGVWDANSNEEGSVEVYNDTYDNGNCAKKGNKDWLAIRFFISDTQSIKGVACYEGDDQSCQDLGVDPGTSDEATFATTTFNVGSYNMCHEINHASGSDKCPSISTKATKIINTIGVGSTVGNPPFDVFGAQEISQPTQQAILAALPDYSSFPDEVPSSNGRAIFWNTATFNDVPLASGYLKGVRGNGDNKDPGSDNNKFPWVELEASTGLKVAIMSEHSPNDKFGTPAERYDNAVKILEWAQQEIDKGMMVIITGDFNNGGKKDGGQPGSYCVLTESGALQHAMDMASGPGASGACPSQKVPIDAIYASSNVGKVTATDWNRIDDGGADSGTDHSPAWVTYTVESGTVSGAGSKFRLGSFNICYGVAAGGNGLAACARGRTMNQRLPLTINNIKKNKLDVVGLQEVRGPSTPSGDQFNGLKSGLPDYAIFPEDHGAGYAGQNPIIWRTDPADGFTLVEGKLIDGYTVTDGGPKSATNTQVRLRDNATGQEFFVINEHEPVGTTTQDETRRRDSANDRAKYVIELKNKNPGIPIFVTGDMNSFYTPTGGRQHALNNSWDNLPYCILTKDTGLKDAYDAAKNQDRKCSGGSSNPSVGVDHIYMSDTVTATGYTYGGGGVKNNGSDHKTLFVDVTIAGEGTGTATGTGSATPYKNPVVSSTKPDPTVILGQDGKYHLYATGGSLSDPFQHLVSSDLVHWEKGGRVLATGNIPSWLHSERWAPDIAKSGSTYFLTFSGGGTGTSCDSGNKRRIGYATSSSAAGPFTYRGTLVNNTSDSCGLDIDSKLLSTDQGLFLYYGSGGAIYSIKMKQTGDSLSTDGLRKIAIVKSSSEPNLVEGAWVQKHEDWYYMYYSSGDYKVKSGSTEYRLNVARSKSPMGPFEKLGKPILTGAGAMRGPGHNSTITDNAGNDWVVYHAWVGVFRALMIDPITYGADGWPTINGGHPSSTQQANGPVTSGAR